MQSKHRRKKCLCCKQPFTTDPRNHHHQRFCTKVHCQKASKILSQKRWSAKPANRDHWRGPSEVVRVQEWRKKFPDYGKRRRRARGSRSSHRQ